MNAPAQIRLTKAAIQRALAILELCPGLEVDEELKLSTLEGETELNELVSQLLSESENDEGMIAAIKEQISVRRERLERLERRIDARKNAIISMMDYARLTKLPLPEATVSLRTLGPRAQVIDKEAVPRDFQKATWSPDMEAIKQAIEDGLHVPGVVLSNGGASLTVRRK